MRRRRILATLLVVLAIAGAIVAQEGGRHAAALAPPWSGGPTQCRSDPLAYVHDPARLEVVRDCATLSGTVVGDRLVRAYNDLMITVRPDARYARYLLAGNHGTFIADVVAQDQPLPITPQVGEWGMFDGTWVIDRTLDTAELLPTWQIAIPGQTAKPIGDTLAVGVQVAQSVAVGAPMPVSVAVWTTRSGSRAPAQQARLFVELVRVGGSGADWRAGLTDPLGTKQLFFVALDVPGTYQLTVHAVKGRQVGDASATIRIYRT